MFIYFFWHTWNESHVRLTYLYDGCSSRNKCKQACVSLLSNTPSRYRPYRSSMLISYTLENRGERSLEAWEEEVSANKKSSTDPLASCLVLPTLAFTCYTNTPSHGSVLSRVTLCDTVSSPLSPCLPPCLHKLWWAFLHTPLPPSQHYLLYLPSVKGRYNIWSCSKAKQVPILPAELTNIAPHHYHLRVVMTVNLTIQRYLYTSST